MSERSTVTPKSSAGTAAVARALGQPGAQLVLCCLVALALAVPHLGALPARDEADAVVAARAITQRGVPVFYGGELLRQGRQVRTLGYFAIPGLPGQSRVLEVRDELGVQTWAENGGTDYSVGNWHPPLYVYLLAAAMLLPLPVVVALRLLNLALLLVSLALLYGIARAVVAPALAGDAPLTSDQEAASDQESSQAVRWIPLIVCLAYVLISFGIRAHMLIEYTTTIAPTTVLLFWSVHLRAPEQGWRGVAARAGALALVAWANLGPLLPLIAALIVAPLLHGRVRRALLMALTCGLGVALFLISFGAFSLWEGVPASATFAHSGSIVAGALAILPHPKAWAHLGGAGAMELLLAAFYGPPALALAGLIWPRRASWRARVPRRAYPWLVLGAVALGMLLATAYLWWQQVNILTGLVLTVLWSFALLDMFALNWGSLPYIWWLLPCLACAAVVASATLARWSSERIQTLALFAGGVTVVTFLAGPRAWGFAKYIAPAYGILVLLAVLCLVGLATRQVRINGGATVAVCGVALLGLAALIWLPDFTCAAPNAQTGLCPDTNNAPLSLWVSAFTALNILMVALLLGLATRAGRQGRATPLANATLSSALVAPIMVVILLPLLLFAAPEQLALAHTSGSIAYDTGDLNGMDQAGAYLAAHAAPGQLVVMRKEIAVYAPNVRFIDDAILPSDYLATHPEVVWVVGPEAAPPGFSAVARFGAWSVYQRAGG